MMFPDYFGNNWDAFEECIRDMSWINAKGYMVVYDNTNHFFLKHPDDAEILESILCEAKSFWESEGVPFEYIVSTDKMLCR